MFIPGPYVYIINTKSSGIGPVGRLSRQPHVNPLFLAKSTRLHLQKQQFKHRENKTQQNAGPRFKNTAGYN